MRRNVTLRQEVRRKEKGCTETCHNASWSLLEWGSWELLQERRAGTRETETDRDRQRQTGKDRDRLKRQDNVMIRF